MANLLVAVVQEVYEEMGNNESAVAKICELIERDSVLLKEAITTAAKATMGKIQTQVRTNIISANINSEVVLSGGFRAIKTYSKDFHAQLSERTAKTFYHWPMMDGSLLKDASKEKVLLMARHHEKIAQGNARNARFLFQVADKLLPGQKVEGNVSEEELATLMAEAAHSTKLQGV